ncbi:MAG: glycosyltransferase family 2 protein [Phycisphaerales bacterium]
MSADDAHGGAIDVSIVIVNWNAKDLLRGCLRSIASETRRSHEVIVVDNASRDDSVAMVREEFPDAVCIANEDNRGFAAANNQGIEVASGRYILLLNPDTVILDGAIDTMLAWCDDRPDVGCAGCQVWEDESTIQRTCFSDPGPLNLLLIETGLHRRFGGSRFFGRPEYSWWDRTTERDVDVVSGMFMLVPRAVVETVGPLDDAFFVYSEEADWCRRIRAAGRRCVFTPVAKILHLEGGGKSTSQIKPRMYVQLQKSKMIYARKHGGFLGGLGARCVLLGSMLARGVVFGLVGAVTRGTETVARARLAWAAARFHLFGAEPA